MRNESIRFFNLKNPGQYVDNISLNPRQYEFSARTLTQ